MTEDDLLIAVLDMARLLGVMTAHFRPARRAGKDGKVRWETPVQGDGKGFPDLVLVGSVGALYRELKSKTGVASPEQGAWLAALAGAGENAAIWRPDDLRSGRIESELRLIVGPQVSRKPPAIRHDESATWVSEADKTVRKPPAWLRADLRRR